MKKAKMIGKKTLSVFLAVLMVLTAWVWVAPTEAEAVNSSGNYTWRLYINCTNAYTGNAAYYTVTGKTNNGQGTDTTISNQTSIAVGSDSIFDKGTNAYFPSSDGTTTTAFPYKVYIHTYKNSGFDFWPGMTDGSYSAELQVKDSSGSWKTICSGDSGVTHGHGDVDLTISHATNNYPSPSSIKWETENTADTADLTIGKTANVTRTMKFNVYDQYGVRMSSAALTSLNKAPTATVTASQSGTLGTSTSSNIYYTLSSSNTDAYYITVTAKPGAKSTTYDSQTITVGASCNSKSLTNRAFTLYDPMYKFTMNPNGGGMISPTTDIEKRYHNTFGYTPNASRTGFTLIGFYTTDYDDSYEDSEVSSSDSKLTSTTYIDGDLTWYAAWQANQYKMKFTYRDENGNWVTTDEVTEYFGRDIPFPTVSSPVNSGVDYTYTFTGWSPAYTTVQAVDGVTEYVAQYDEEVHYADKTALSEAIAKAEEKMNEQKYIDGGYTAETVAAFQSVLQQADDATDMIYLLSQQSAVDVIIKNLLNSINNLKSKSFIVMFVDEDGTILKDGYHFVEYGDKVEIPANPTQEPDADYHYEFLQWDSTLSDGLDACNYITDDLRYIANFNAFPHEFTETVTPSTCTADGIITKECSCGFSYTVAGETAGHKWSTDYKELVPATCATKGTEAKYCTACGAFDESTKRDIAELGHKFGAYTEYTPATCFGEGSEIAECSRCGGKNVRKLAQKTHAYGTAEEIEKTCTTDGYTKEVCTLCGFTNIRDIDKATGHSISTTTVDSTCVSSGYAKTFCENCDFEKTIVYPATGVHTFIDNWTTVSEASCVGHGVEKRVCTVCNAATETRLTDLAAHTEPADWTTEKEAWCGLEGRKVKDCTVCGKELKSETIAALKHNYEAYAEGSYAPTCTSAGAEAEKCSRCGDINTTVIQPLGHNWNAGVITEATCTSGAYTTYTCQRENCGETKVVVPNGAQANLHDFTGTETIIDAATCEADGKKTVQCKNCTETTTVVIPKLGHSYGAWVVEKEATNNEDGKWTRTCSKCNDVEEITIPAGGHEWDNGTVKEEATCTETGTMVYKCNNPAHTDCGVTLEVTIPVKQHTVVQKIEEASCTKKGSVKAYCSVCDANCEKPFSTQEIPVKAHVYTAGTAVAPTCTTSGYTLYECTAENCDFSYKAYDENQPATGHTYTSAVTKDASCTEEGVKTFTCSCGASYTEEIPATGHTYVKGTVTAANCTTAGTEVYTCSCGDTYTKFIEAAKGHTYTNWEVVTPATADKSGVQKGTCACGDVKYDVLAPIGNHIFTEEVTKAATCTTAGEKTYTCSEHTNCSANYTEKIPATGHKGVLNYTAPTCYSEGSTQIVCETCDAKITEAISIPTTAHTYGEGKVTTAATCTSDGVMTFTCTVAKCGATRTEVIEKSGHSLSTTLTDAKCGEKGSVVTECKVCNDPTVKTVTELAAKGHIWKDTPESTIDADCENNGSKTYKCQNCEETNVVVLPKLGHNWSDWTVIPSTNNDKGSVSRTCSVCNEVEKVDIPAGGHELVVDTDKSTAANCTTEGKTVYKCKNHADCGITVTVTVPVKQHTVVQREILATCDIEGKVEAYCSVCNSVLSTEVIPVKAHVYTAGDPVDATCTTSGYTPYTCSCGDTYNKYDEDKPANGHNFTGAETIINAATCTTDGSKTVKCADCDVKNLVVIPKTGHNYTVTATTDATCKVAATKTYKCDNEGCNSTYVEYVSGTAEHTWGNWTTVQEVTTTSHGIEKRECSVCGVVEHKTTAPTGAHEFENKGGTPATCTSEGSIIWECKTHTNCEANYTETLDKLPHTEKIAYTAPTCTSVGYSKVVCSVESCKAEIMSEEIPAKGHAYNTVEVTTEPGCESTGTRTYRCSCGDEYTEKIPAKGHSFKTTVTDATCTAKGSVVTECIVCKEESAKTTIELAAKNHSWNDGEVTTAATCTTEGVKTYTCTICSTKKTEPIAKSGHNWNDWVKTDATNSKDGEWKRVCKTDENHVETLVIPKGGHTFGDVPDSTTPATCTATGTATYNCTAHTGENACGVTITVTLDKLQHNMVTTTETNVTCETPGKTITKCTTCDTQTTETVIPATGHAWGEGVKTNATCTSEGKIVYTCTAKECGKTKEVILDKLQHNYVAGAPVAATCTSSGYTPYKCETCDSSYVILGDAAKGHSWTEWTVEKAATNTEKGLLSRTCINGCGEKETAEIPAGGHTFDTKNPVSTTQGTCETKGTKTFKCTAHTNCGIEITVETEFGSHAWSDWTKVDATNDEDGYWTRKCATCEEEETLVIPAGNHNLVEDTTKYVEPKCDAKGQRVYKCDAHENCSVTITVVLERVQHTAGVDKKDATCTENGYVKTYCTACGELISEKELPLIAHNYDANGDGKVDKKDAVFEDGTYTYTCQAGCGHTITEDAVDVYKVRFFDAAGNQIGEDQNVKFGESAVAPAAPEKKADGTYHYEFSSWDRNYGEITSDLDVYPTYEKELHYGGEATCKDKALCDKCGTPYGETDDSKHVIATKIKSATCEESGTITYYCSEGCGKATTVEEIKPMGHDFGEWEIYQAGSCAAPTIKIRKCRNYGCDKHERWEIENSHNWHIVKEIPPTCTAVGYSEYKYCLSCGTAVDSVKIPALGHRDNNGDGRCDYCTYVQNEVKCNCMCHSTGFMKFIYSIVRFFWRLTKSTPSCSCGARHY